MLKKKLATARRVYLEDGLRGLATAMGRKFGYAPPDRSRVDEVAIVSEALQIEQRPGTMIDVGGHFGGTALPYCKAGWRVVAFEPDSRNRAKLVESIGSFANATIDERALSNEEKDAVIFYRSDQSTGISGLSAFHETHVAADTVAMTTLSKALAQHKIDKVDFLKIDTEGFDKFVLEGFPWDQMKPRVIVCEFEDFKTQPLGYDFRDFATYLTSKGYSVLVSEWQPIVRYGVAHTWADFKAWPCALDSPKGWGNFIATIDPALRARIDTICQRVKKSFH